MPGIGPRIDDSLFVLEKKSSEAIRFTPRTKKNKSRERGGAGKGEEAKNTTTLRGGVARTRGIIIIILMAGQR